MQALNRSMVQCMPAHNPIYAKGQVRFRGTVSEARVAVENPRAVVALLPEPLTYDDRGIFIVHLEMTRLLEGFPTGLPLWNEIAIKIPVVYNGEQCLYLCEVYCSEIFSIISGREQYGYPKVPARISVQRSDAALDVQLCGHLPDEGIMNFAAEGAGEIPPRMELPAPGLGKSMPKTILYKYIPSAVPGRPPDVEQLITVKYGRPVIHRFSLGKGKIGILEGAPDYLKEARISSVIEMSCLDMETHVLGGEVLHNYQA